MLTTLLIEHKRLALLGLVLQEIVSLYKDKKGIEEITVTSSHALSTEQQQIIEKYSTEQFPGKKLEYIYKQDPRLLVGMLLLSKHKRWERSLNKLLHEIKLSEPTVG